MLEPLGERYNVIALDLPGFGHSPALSPEVAPTPQALARAVAALLDELGIGRAHVAGNSLGGWVALELGKQGRARSVCALCPAGLWGAPVVAPGTVVRSRAHRLARRLRSAIPVLMLSPQVRRLALAPFVADPGKVPYRAAWRMLSSYGRGTAYDATSAAMRQDFFRDPELITVPVTLAFGERDRLIRPTRAAITAAHQVVLSGCGHVPMWDDPELVTAVIDETARRATAPATAA
ncbi:MAG: alpha/beta hydrolase [Actinomycetota bacterium]|nr:alpha/beta hydrolase [Actinomycetota bacterium]